MKFFNKVRLKLVHKFNEIFICKIISVLPLKIERKIVFDNFLGKGYGENPKYIAEKIIQEGLPYKIIWLVNDIKEDMPEQVCKVKYGSVRALYEMATACAWVDNVRNTMRPAKKRNQIYLQTWHGVYGDKPVEKEAEKFLSLQYVQKAKKDGREIDGIISANGFESKLYRENFWLNEKAEILEFGSPAYEDFYVSISDKSKRQKLRILNGLDKKYVVIYAPTFRDDYNSDAYDIDCERVLKAFKKKYGPCVLIIRLHPNVADQKNRFQFNDCIINGERYYSFFELVYMGDAIISDYSSTLYDFALAGKPAFVYASDIEQYFGKRGSTDRFYSDPFEKARDNNELESIILNFNENDYKNRIKKFFSEYPLYGPVGASKKCVDWLNFKITNMEKM